MPALHIHIFFHNLRMRQRPMNDCPPDRKTPSSNAGKLPIGPVKPCPGRSLMKDMKSLKPVPDGAKTRLAAVRRLILLGLLAPLLLTAAATGQSGWPPPIPKFFLPAPPGPEATAARQARPQDPAKLHPDLQQSAGPPAPAPLAGRAASGFHQKFRPEPAVPGWPPANPNSPWPPASAFVLQTNLRKYLDTWPTPGATSTDDWPEYVGESDQELD
jgi:hypothetical protein